MPDGIPLDRNVYKLYSCNFVNCVTPKARILIVIRLRFTFIVILYYGTKPTRSRFYQSKF